MVGITSERSAYTWVLHSTVDTLFLIISLSVKSWVQDVVVWLMNQQNDSKTFLFDFFTFIILRICFPLNSSLKIISLFEFF